MEYICKYGSCQIKQESFDVSFHFKFKTSCIFPLSHNFYQTLKIKAQNVKDYEYSCLLLVCSLYLVSSAVLVAGMWVRRQRGKVTLIHFCWQTVSWTRLSFLSQLVRQPQASLTFDWELLRFRLSAVLGEIFSRAVLIDEAEVDEMVQNVRMIKP